MVGHQAEHLLQIWNISFKLSRVKNVVIYFNFFVYNLIYIYINVNVKQRQLVLYVVMWDANKGQCVRGDRYTRDKHAKQEPWCIAHARQTKAPQHHIHKLKTLISHLGSISSINLLYIVFFFLFLISIKNKSLFLLTIPAHRPPSGRVERVLVASLS